MEKLPEQKFKWSYAILILALLLILGFAASAIISFFAGDDAGSLGGNVALISIDGVISGSKDGSLIFEKGTSSLDAVELIEKADKNQAIKAIILEINSPGGSAVASEEIANAVKKINKTTVAWIREVGASGGYWVASSTNHIVADRMSITGSIGVIASYLEFPGLLENYNVTYRRLVSGKYKDIGSPYKEMTSEEKAVFQQVIDELRDYFVSEVAKNRKMSRKDVDKAANGLFYSGLQAKELGLIDELGSKDEVIKYIEQKENIKAEIVEYKKSKSILDVFSAEMSSQSFSVGKGIGSALLDRKAASEISITT